MVRPSPSEPRPAARGRNHWRLIAWIAGLILVIVIGAQHARKVSKGRSAFVRWRVQIQQLVQGQNVYVGETDVGDIDDSDDTLGPYPNPPLMAVALYPLASLPAVAGASIWFGLKVALAGLALYWSLRLAAGHEPRVPLWSGLVALALSFRMILSDLQHGNVNILICFLIVAALWSLANRHDLIAGLLLALAITFKVTPLLFLPYFLYKRQWRVAGWMIVGLGLFLFVVPGLVLGQRHNAMLLVLWLDAMIEPYLLRGVVETLQINQSLPGLLHRLLTDSPGIKFSDNVGAQVNWLSLAPATVGWIVRIATLAILLLLAWLCRTPMNDRRDWRLACEYGLVLLAMLFISERSWKHHYVVMILPIACVAVSAAFPHRPGHSRRFSAFLLIMLGLSMLLMMSTSKEMTGWLTPDGQGHKWAQACNTFMWAGVMIFIALATILRRGAARPTNRALLRTGSSDWAERPVASGS